MCVCVSRVLVWHAIPSSLPSEVIAWELEGRDSSGQVSMGACGVSGMEWIMLLNYANCLWSPTVLRVYAHK